MVGDAIEGSLSGSDRPGVISIETGEQDRKQLEVFFLSCIMGIEDSFPLNEKL